MSIRFLNCFTCNARVPSSMRSGTLCLLVETDQGLVLVDAGLGQRDYVKKPAILRVFQVITHVPLDPQEAAVHQLAHLGVRAEDVHHVVLTHMHFDHCGGLRDFPHATVHVHRREYEAFNGRPRIWTDFAYVRRHLAHQPRVELYEVEKDRWFNFPAVRLPFEPAFWLVPLFGHSRGHCGLALETENGWLFHVADAAGLGLDGTVPDWLAGLVLGPHIPALRRFAANHPEIRITTGHMRLEFFDNCQAG